MLSPKKKKKNYTTVLTDGLTQRSRYQELESEDILKWSYRDRSTKCREYIAYVRVREQNLQPKKYIMLLYYNFFIYLCYYNTKKIFLFYNSYIY